MQYIDRITNSTTVKETKEKCSKIIANTSAKLHKTT